MRVKKTPYDVKNTGAAVAVGIPAAGIPAPRLGCSNYAAVVSGDGERVFGHVGAESAIPN